MTVVSGHLARLNCRVRNLGNRTVSWIRLKDLSLLTVGRYTYTSDLRFGLSSLFHLFSLLRTQVWGDPRQAQPRLAAGPEEHSADWFRCSWCKQAFFIAVSTQDLTSARSQRAPTWPTWSTSGSEVTPWKYSWWPFFRSGDPSGWRARDVCGVLKHDQPHLPGCLDCQASW